MTLIVEMEECFLCSAFIFLLVLALVVVACHDVTFRRM